MRIYILAILLLLLVGHIHAQSNSGIYLTLKCDKNTKKHKVMFAVQDSDITKKPVCVTSQPIIAVEDFEKVSELQEFDIANQRFTYFDLTLSQKGFKTLDKVKRSLTTATISLMVEDNILFILNVSEIEFLKTFRFQTYGTKSQLESIHRKLKEMIGASQALTER
jgi:hypothetical protein